MSLTVQITASPCRDNPALAKCPRCWRWHHGVNGLPWPVESAKDGVADRHRICVRCEGVLLEDWPDHAVSHAIRAHWKAA